MAVERKKEKQKTPAELAAEQTAGEVSGRQAPAEKEPKRPRARARAAPGEKAKATSKPGPRAQARRATEEKAGESRPAPTRRRSPAREREPGAPVRPVVRAQAKYVRSSARKARLVIEHIRGKSIEDARAVLRHTPRGIARDLEKLLESAIANAENNHDLVGDDLVIKDVYADEGPTIKRFRPRALGRATRIRKRTSHLTVTLTPKE
jgi:ribosomal protein L22